MDWWTKWLLVLAAMVVGFFVYRCLRALLLAPGKNPRNYEAIVQPIFGVVLILGIPFILAQIIDLSVINLVLPIALFLIHYAVLGKIVLRVDNFNLEDWVILIASGITWLSVSIIFHIVLQ
ncbi:MAG: hypothetical protein JXA82_04665 [Sedimentisphaerales bacterium]|nr:hypothetical protein [Sedimentisphaerales bacterium]